MKIKNIDRIVAHKIIKKKSEKVPSYCVLSDCLLQYNDTDKAILKERIETAINNQTKCFKLEFKNIRENFVYDKLSESGYRTEDSDFLELSQTFASLMAEAHTSINYPSGYCIVGDGRLDGGKYFVFVIKADYQEVFNIVSNQLHLISDVFLSPAKDFYKVGFFVEENSKFTPYMFDDQFSNSKRDLTAYFYDAFLGLTTDRNDVLRTKNFYDDVYRFIDTKITDPKDKIGMQKALQVYIRENADNTASARAFYDLHLKGTEIASEFETSIIEKYPRAFTLDRKLLTDTKLSLQRISLGQNITILSKSENLNIEVVPNPTSAECAPLINSGKVKNAVFFVVDDLIE